MAICPCDQPINDTCLDIPPGLRTLPRQARGFAEVKSRLLASVATQPALKGWTGEAGQDLGVMLLDMWSYVLDVTQFYDAKITDEFYLGTAKRDLSTHRIIGLLGYEPAPALAAEATLIGEVNKADPVKIPAKSGFRSEAFDDEPPQVFQTLTDHQLEPARNRWQLAPVDDDAYPGRVLLRPSENGVPKRGVVAFTVDDVPHHASEIAGRTTYLGADDRKMAEVLLEDPLDVPEGTRVDQIRIRLMGLRAGESPLAPSFEADTLYLDTIYPQLRDGELAVLEIGDALVPFSIKSATRSDLALETETGATIPVMVSKVVMEPTPGFTLAEDTEWRLHFNPVRVGRLRAPYKTEIDLTDLDPNARLQKPRHMQTATLAGDFMVRGAAGAGAEIKGQVARDVVGRDVSFAPDTGQDDFATALQTPVHLFGNLIRTVRTEQIENEVLGSGDAANAINQFKLKKAPLTWITDASQPSNRRPLIDVRVDGILWDRVDSFYTMGPQDRIYRLRRDAVGDTWVVFGDGMRGARPSSGAGNITTSYGHGAGAAKPPPGAITQTARPIKGLGRVMNPISSMGGSDAEKAEEIRANAPATVLTLGRAVSVQDFTALARTFAGVLNVTSGWAWHPTRQRAVVALWVASDGGLDLDALRNWLEGMAATDTPVAVEIATPVTRSLAISADVDPAYPAEETLAAARAALDDPKTGLLAVRNVPIGGAIYRSAIVKAVQTVPGIMAVPSVLRDGVEMAWAVRVATGTYADFTNNITVA